MNRNSILAFCCALLCSVLFCVPSQAQTKKLSIVKAHAPFLQMESNTSIYLHLDGFEVENSCNGKTQESWHLLDSNKTVLKNTVAIGCQSLFPTSYQFAKQDSKKKFYVRYKVANNCGEKDSIDYLIDLSTVKPIKFTCLQGLAFDLMPSTGYTVLLAEQFLVPLTNEKPVELRIDKAYYDVGYLKGLPKYDTTHVSCVGIVPIKVWAKYSNTDWNYCDAYIEMQNNMGATAQYGCPICTIGVGSFTSGIITTPNGKAIDNAIVTVESKAFPTGKMTGKVVSGRFSVGVSSSNNFKLYPTKDDNPLNGVSTFDLMLLNRHIVGTQVIKDKYLLIAADVNNSGKISTADVVELRKMVLGIQKDFSNNKSWRFFNELDKEAVDSTQALCNYNFTAVKIGDINGNANAASTPRASKTHIFKLENQDLAEGDIYTLSLKGVDAFAFTLRYDVERLELISLDENSALLENGLITTAQIGSEFKAIFKAKANIQLRKAFQLSSDVTQAEAIVADELQDIALQFSESATAFEAKIYPNPADNFLHIETSETINGEAIITNLLGQVIVNQSIIESQKTTLNVGFLPKGIYSLTLKTDKGNVSKKLIMDKE